MKLFRTISAGVLAAGLLLPVSTLAQQAPITTATSGAKTPGPQTWTSDQLLTSTVHEAWLLSGKNEATFFEMVTQLATMSAQKRGLALPETEAAGRRFGELVKANAKLDTDQLLYAVVDKAVKKIGTPAKS